ncbi:hypothetical protein Trydic_g2140 [Trypoxylus dichotomus]
MAKKLEEPKKNEKPTKKDRAPEGEEGGDSAQEQDEWKDFEEEKKDYTGLKIGNLTINSNGEGNIDGAESSNEQQQRYDESGNEVEKKIGPWKKIEVPEQPVSEKEEKKTEPPPSSTGVYISPALRNVQQQQQVQHPRARGKTAPDIHNEEYFPTLSGSKSDRRNREGSFEVVSHSKSTSHRYAEQSKLASSQGPKLALGNRFNTLSNDS